MANKYFLVLCFVILGFFPVKAEVINEHFRTDFVWHYMQTNPTGTDRWDFQMEFTGVEVIDSIEFHLFGITSARELSSRGSDPKVSPRSVLPDRTEPFYLYAEGEKVYLSLRHGALHYALDNTGDLWQGDRALVYDFSVEPGDTIFPASEEGNKCMAIVDSIGEVEVDNKMVKAYTVGGGFFLPQSPTGEKYYNTIKGIGTIYGYYPLYDNCHAPTLMGGELLAPSQSIYLVKVTDKKGNLVFQTKEGEEYEQWLNSIEESKLNDTDTYPIYSLQGLPVTNPQPGQIYIRNGKKFVMPK